MFIQSSTFHCKEQNSLTADQICLIFEYSGLGGCIYDTMQSQFNPIEEQKRYRQYPAESRNGRL